LRPIPNRSKEPPMRKTPLAVLTALLFASACGGEVDESSMDPDVAESAATAAGPGFIVNASYVGTGCPKGSTTTGLSLDKQAATSIFSGFITSPTPSGEKVSRNCLTTMKINVPRGWSYALESVDVRGFADLPKGVTASRQSVYVITGSPVLAPPVSRVRGAISDDYNQADVGPAAPSPWSPCGGGQVLRIATQTEVTGRGTGQFTIDSIDTELKWRRCK
jgi:Domain of unknown function (DUF4360)